MSWGSVEWDPDCDSKLSEHLFGSNNSDKKKVKKKHKKTLHDVFTRVTASNGRFVRVQQTVNSDNNNASSVGTKLPDLQSNKRKFSVGSCRPSKKIKLNGNISVNSNAKETLRYKDNKETNADGKLHDTGCQKTRKKKRMKKKKVSSLQGINESEISLKLKKIHKGENSNENVHIAVKRTSNKTNNLSSKDTVKLIKNQLPTVHSNFFQSASQAEKHTVKSEVLKDENAQNAATSIQIKSPYNIKNLKQCLKKHFSSPSALIAKQSSANPLREKMMRKLQASHFRYINEQLYSSKSEENMGFFQNNLSTFEAYHEGYQQQVAQWPLNPLNVIINSLKKKSTKTVIADFGCGEAQLAKSLPDHKVYSFDFVATCDLVTPCDMSNTPLENGSVDIVVFCLSLMGNNLSTYILEANRVLKDGGMMMIAEVESRFENVDTFIQDIKKFGFSNTWKDFSHKIFYFLYFKKISSVKKSNKLPNIILKSCLYKKR